MAWISVHTGIDGPKLRDLRKKLNCSKFEATGILVYLWFWGLENAEKSGKILHADKDDIAECLSESAAGCKMPADMIASALLDTGWIDYDGESFYIHDWEIWQNQWYKAKERRESEAERKRISRRKNAVLDDLNGSSRELPEPKAETVATEPVSEERKSGRNSGYTPFFEQFWSAYPRKNDKGAAYKKYKARLNDGYSEEELLKAASLYAAECQRAGTDPKYIKHAKTFLGETLPFTEYIPKETGQPEEKKQGDNPFIDWR